MGETGRRRRTPVVIVILLGMTIGFGTISILRARQLKYDFSHFYVDATYLLKHGRLNTQDHLQEKEGGRHLCWYLPLITILFVPIAALEPLPAGVVWFVICWLCLLATVRWIGQRLTSMPSKDWLLTQASAVILCGGAIFENCHFNQLSFVVLAGVAASYGLIRSGRPWLAGVVLSAVTLTKLVPAVFGLWWLVRRRWRALGAFFIGLLVFDIGLNLLDFL